MNANENIDSNLLSLAKLNWIYRGEGNANLVISLPEEKIILRMQKCENTESQTAKSVHQNEYRLIRDVQFYKRIMVPLLGKAFVPTPFLIRISEKEVSELNDMLSSVRPSFRLNKKLFYTLITGQPDYTHIFPSLTFLPNGLHCTDDLDRNSTYCIEIKPKQGWLHELDRIHPTCTFCTNQYLKLVKKSVKTISGYCPLDLFSGNACRMKRAIKNLLKTPQNNLKIFKDGNVIYDDDSCNDYIDVLQEILEPNSQKADAERLVEKWAALLHEALTKNMCDEPRWDMNFNKDLEANKKDIYNFSKSSSFHGLIPNCDWSSEPLPDNCVLQRILAIQKLQVAGFKETYDLYCDRRHKESDYDYVEQLNLRKDFDAIDRYLLSTTAKDCSLFIALQPCSRRNSIDKSQHHLTDFDGVNYRFNIGVADLDPKPLSCIEKHHKRENDFLLAMLCHLNSKKA